MSRKVLLITISILLVAIIAISFFFLKEMFPGWNNAGLYAQKYEQPSEPSAAPENISQNNPPETGENSPNNPAGSETDISPSPIGGAPSPAGNANMTKQEGNSENPEPSPNSEGDGGNSNKDETKAVTPTPTSTPSKNVLNVMFLGIDRTEDREKTRISSAADTIMLARVDIDNKTMRVLSIPRDTYAYIPIADKMDKINSAYSYGAQAGKAIWSIKDTLKKLLGESCRIDAYFTLDMEPIPDIIDELGGVEVDVELDMQSHGVNLSKGLQVLDGKAAYDYIRWRYAGDGDIGRIRRQQGFIKAMLSKLQASDMKKDLLRIILSYEDYINTDLGLEQLDSIINLCADISEQDIQFYVLPGEGKTLENTSYWVINEEKVKQVLDDFFK